MQTPSRLAIELDKLLALTFLALLVALGIARGEAIFEPLRRSLLTLVTLSLLPVVLYIAIRTQAQGAVRRFARDWWPLMCTLAVYESLKQLHANRITEWLGITPKDALMLRIDEMLFGRALPLWFDSWTAPWFQGLMWNCYVGLYFLWPIVLLSWAYLWRDEALFRRLRVGLVLGLLGGYVIYLLVPVAGPLYLIGERFQHPIPTQPQIGRFVFDSLRFQWDCFPSLHTAIPWLLTTLSWHALGRPARALSVVLACAVTLSTVVLRLHYGIDLIAGLVWVALVHAAVEGLRPRDYGRFALPSFR